MKATKIGGALDSESKNQITSIRALFFSRSSLLQLDVGACASSSMSRADSGNSAVQEMGFGECLYPNLSRYALWSWKTSNNWTCSCAMPAFFIHVCKAPTSSILRRKRCKSPRLPAFLPVRTLVENSPEVHSRAWMLSIMWFRHHIFSLFVLHIEVMHSSLYAESNGVFLPHVVSPSSTKARNSASARMFL